MTSLAALAAPLALMLPVLSMDAGAHSRVDDANATNGGPPVMEPVRHSPEALARGDGQRRQPTAANASGRVPLEALIADLRARQIRIEQRVIVRITPQRGSNRRSLLAQLPQRALNTRYEERKAGECIAVEDIAGVQTGSGNRLLLFLRDREIMSLNLEKACRARDFYSGFYVERNADGRICINRDELQSRNGARCEIDRMMELVALDN